MGRRTFKVSMEATAFVLRRLYPGFRSRVTRVEFKSTLLACLIHASFLLFIDALPPQRPCFICYMFPIVCTPLVLSLLRLLSATT